MTALRLPITLALARFEDIVSHGLRALIAADPRLRLLVSDVPPERMADALGAHAPNVAILNFASLCGPMQLRQLHAAFPRTRLMVIANNPSVAQCRQLIGFGATACLGKNVDGRDLLEVIRLAAAGLYVLPSDPRPAEEPPWGAPLTAREADVLELLQAARSNAEIAEALNVSVETVRTHARNIYRKLGVSTRRELRALI
jgi:DNA-binding NarL/FixJ family response regulator